MFTIHVARTVMIIVSGWFLSRLSPLIEFLLVVLSVLIINRVFLLMGPSLTIFSTWMARLKSACRRRVTSKLATGTLIKGTMVLASGKRPVRDPTHRLQLLAHLHFPVGSLHDHVINYKVGDEYSACQAE